MKTNLKQKALYSLLLIVLLFNVQPAFSFNFNGNAANDLNNVDLTDEIKSWTVSRAINSQALSTSIGGVNFLGGPNVLGTTSTSLSDSFSRTYKTLPKHTMITFTFTLAVCGDWTGDAIKVTFDGVSVGNLQFDKKDFVAGVCGSAAGLNDVVVSGRIPHNMNTVTLKIASGFNKPSSKTSFGVRDFSLNFVNAASSAVKSDICLSSSTSSSLSYNQCACSIGNYPVISALTSSTAPKCNAGSPFCLTSFGASAAECYSCAKGTYFDGKNCVPCDGSCLECTGPGPSKCTKVKPVCIQDSHGNCVDSCPAPLTLNTAAKTCTSPCTGSDFLYPDGSCLPSCPSDLVQVTIGCYNLCTSPCKVGFLTCEGTCQTSCVAPAQNRDTNGICYCDWPCPQGEYYWQENTKDQCVGDCPLPWECGTDSKTNIPICQPKCDPDSKLYVYVKEEDKCDCECPSGYSVQKVMGLYQCMPICSSDKVFWPEGGEGQTCLSQCPDGWNTLTDSHGNKYCDKICCGADNIFFNGQCVCECPQGWQTLMVNKVPMCLPLCDCGQYWWEEGSDNGLGSCLNKCPVAWVEAKDANGLDICQRQCCDADKAWFPEEGQCVCDCPDGWISATINDALVCVEACECDEFWWAGCDGKASCVDKCPDGWKPDTGCEGVDICSPQCPADSALPTWFSAKGECVCECPTGWIAQEVNGVSQCERACDCGDYWWQECSPAGACVDKCPDGWKADKGCEDVDLCIPQCCPEEIFFPPLQQCMGECPPGWTSAQINDVSICVHACAWEEYWWSEGGANGACVCECPDGWKCDTGCEGVKICSPMCNPTDEKNIWSSVEGQCVCECCDGWVAQEINGGLQCVKACKEGESWWKDCNGSGEGACVCECPEGWQSVKGCDDADICAPYCPQDGESFIWHSPQSQCVCECPPGWTKAQVNDVWQCVHTCECDEYWWSQGGTDAGACVCSCPEGWKCDKGCDGVDICSPICNPLDTENIFFPKTGECVCECPDGFVAQEINGGLQCVEVCKEGQFWWEGCDGKESCVDVCPEGWKCDKGCAGVDICSPQCAADAPENIYLAPEDTCVCECPPGYAKDMVNDVWQCVPVCDCDQYWWVDGGSNGACVDKCPAGWKCDTGCGDIQICTPQCDCESPENTWFGEEGQCVCDCPPGWVKADVNSVLQCVQSCECGQYWWQECGNEGACVDKCPEGWKCDKGVENVDICTPQCDCEGPDKVWFGEKGECGCDCCPGWIAEEVNGVLQCVHACGCDQYWWVDGGANGACVDTCPDGWILSKGCEDVDVCTPRCPEGESWFAEKGECVCDCPPGWVKADINNVPQCVHSCPCGEYWWQDCGNEGACVDKCPEGWTTDKGCEYVDICSPQCPADSPQNLWVPASQSCACDCADGYTKALVNDVWQCIPICKWGQYWWAQGGESGACVCECPLGWSWATGFGDIDICVPVCDLTCDEKNFFELNDECLSCCPTGTTSQIVNGVPMCVKICSEGELWWCEGADEGSCVCECPLGWVAGVGPGDIPICTPQCDATCPDNVWYDEKGLCVGECPEGWKADTINGVLVCDHVCEKGDRWWIAGGDNGACVCDCPEAWTAAEGCDGADICAPQCDQSSPDFIWLNGQCVCECPCGWREEKVNGLPVCKKMCPHGQLWWELAAECVFECPDGYKCDKDSYGQDVCVPQCDLNTPERVWSPTDGQCVCDCPAGTMVNTVNKVLTCTPTCNDDF